MIYYLLISSWFRCGSCFIYYNFVPSARLSVHFIGVHSLLPFPPLLLSCVLPVTISSRLSSLCPFSLYPPEFPFSMARKTPKIEKFKPNNVENNKTTNIPTKIAYTKITKRFSGSFNSTVNSTGSVQLPNCNTTHRASTRASIYVCVYCITDMLINRFSISICQCIQL